MGNKIGKGLAQFLHSATYAAIFAVGSFALVQQAGAEGVVDTKHNLSATAPAGGSPGEARANYMTAASGGTTQVCVFCHTPHGAASTEAPLWQRDIANKTYKTYGSTNASTSMDAEQGTGNVTVGSISLACLSCHDGTQAMNTMSNTPGSGHLASGKAAGDWAANGRNTDGKLTGIAMLVETDKELQNDHPIGIRYAGGFTYSSSATSVASTSFKDQQFRAATQASVNNSPVWFVEPKTTPTGGASGARDKNDIQLYTRPYGAAGNYQPYVECASCHDPHSNAELFLRVPVAGSEVCLTCHIK